MRGGEQREKMERKRKKTKKGGRKEERLGGKGGGKEREGGREKGSETSKTGRVLADLPVRFKTQVISGDRMLNEDVALVVRSRLLLFACNL